MFLKCVVGDPFRTRNGPERGVGTVNHRDVVSISSLLEMRFYAVTRCLYSDCDVTDVSVMWTMTSYNFLSRQNGRGPTDTGYKRRDFPEDFSCFLMVAK